MKKHNMLILLLLLIFLFIFFSCTNGSNWYPAGTVEVSKYRVYDDPTGIRNCLVFYKIENTGQSKINQSTISMAIKTDKGDYFTTIVDTTVVLPGKDIYGSINVSFFDNTEVVTDESNINIIDYFFE